MFNNPDNLPSSMVGALIAYAKHGAPLGGFLTALVENNFINVVSSADSTNSRLLKEYALFLYNELPSPCWGSKEKVKAHYESFYKKDSSE